MSKSKRKVDVREQRNGDISISVGAVAKGEEREVLKLSEREAIILIMKLTNLYNDILECCWAENGGRNGN